MRIDYWALLKLGLLVFAVLLLMAWLPDGIHGLSRVLPSHSHTGEYNRAAIVLIVIGIGGLGQMGRRKGWF